MYCNYRIEKGVVVDLCEPYLDSSIWYRTKKDATPYLKMRFMPHGYFQITPYGKPYWVQNKRFKTGLESTDSREEIICYLSGDYTGKEASIEEANKCLLDAKLLNREELNDLGEYLGCWHLNWEPALESVMALAYARAYKSCGATAHRKFKNSYARFKKLSLHNKKLTCAIMECGFDPERAMDSMYNWSVYVGDGVFYVAPRFNLEVIK